MLGSVGVTLWGLGWWMLLFASLAGATGFTWNTGWRNHVFILGWIGFPAGGMGASRAFF